MPKEYPETRIQLVYAQRETIFRATHWEINANGTGLLRNRNHKEKLMLIPNKHLLHVLIPGVE